MTERAFALAVNDSPQAQRMARLQRLRRALQIGFFALFGAYCFSELHALLAVGPVDNILCDRARFTLAQLRHQGADRFTGGGKAIIGAFAILLAGKPVGHVAG